MIWQNIESEKNSPEIIPTLSANNFQQQLEVVGKENEETKEQESSTSLSPSRNNPIYSGQLEIERAFGKELIESIAPTTNGRNMEQDNKHEADTYLSQQLSQARDVRE